MPETHAIPDDHLERADELAERLTETGVIGEEQARVWVLRTVFGHGRAETIAALDKHEKTVDNLWYQANQRVHNARQLFETFVGQTDLLPVRKSNRMWHRDVFDFQACESAYYIFTNKSYEFKYVHEDQIDSLGKLCDECFEEVK